MTSQKALKARIRARMAASGERYATARRHVAGDGAARAPSPGAEVPVVDHGYALRGGTDPDAAALANVLAHRGVVGPDGPLPEALVLGIMGGLGAGYILWEWKHDSSTTVTLGFTHAWNYLDRRLVPAVERLGLDAEWTRTGGRRAAADGLRSALAAGDPAIVWPDRFQVGYWRLPPHLDGHGGHPVVAYAEADGRIRVDDRTLAPLTVAGPDLDRARARVGSYRNAMCVIRTEDTRIDGATLRSAVEAGIRAQVDHLSSPSESFGLPAWQKWSRLMVDPKNVKGWPRVFADRHGLLGALLSVWEGVEPAGMAGGNLRTEIANFLELAADITGRAELAAGAPRWREAAAIWHELAEAAAPADVPVVARARELTAAVTGAVAEGDAGAEDRSAAAGELWALRAAHADDPLLAADGVDDLFARMSRHLAAIGEAESSAIAHLRESM